MGPVPGAGRTHEGRAPADPQHPGVGSAEACSTLTAPGAGFAPALVFQQHSLTFIGGSFIPAVNNL